MGYSFGHAGTTPDFVMRTGSYAMFDPLDARRDVKAKFIERWTRKTVGRQPMSQGIRTVPPPVPVGPITAPKPAAPLPAPDVPAPAATAGFMGVLGAEGEEEEEEAPAVVVEPAVDATGYLWGAAAGAGVGLVGGLLLSLFQPAYSRSYLTNSLVGVGAGAGAGMAALLVSEHV